MGTDLILLRFAAEAMIGEIRIVPGFQIRSGARRRAGATGFASAFDRRRTCNRTGGASGTQVSEKLAQET
jgi:hypothetical protein